MWAFMLMICMGPEERCVPNWSNTSVFKTEEECYSSVKSNLLAGVDKFTSEGNDILYVGGECIYFDYILKEGEPT